jgi:Tfp pilus assembly protein FimT
MITRTPSGRRPVRRGFTLAELLAVVGVIMILVVGSFGVLAMVGEARGPQSALPTLQSMCNAARDMAVTNGAMARIKFICTSAGSGSTAGSQTVMSLEKSTDNGNSWKAVPDQVEVPIAEHMMILVLAGNGSSKAYAVTMPSTDPSAPSYRGDVLTAMTNAGNIYAGKPGSPASSSSTIFYLVFNATGAVDPSSDVQTTMVVVDRSADGQVQGYAIYLLNKNTGTRLVFE